MPTPPLRPPPPIIRTMTPPGADTPAVAYPTVTGPATIEVTINGALYRWTGTAAFAGGLWAPAGAVWAGKWALVTPSPIPSAVTGYVDSTGQKVTSVSAGSAFVIQGRGFGTVRGQAQLDAAAGSPTPFALSISAWSDTAVTVTMPATGALPAAATVTVQTAAGGRLTGPLLSITPAPLALADPQISGYTAPDGSPIGWPWAGKPLAIHGMNFGQAPGTLRMDWQPVPFSRWTDTEIDTTYPTGLTHDAAVWTVTRPDGAWYSGAVWALQSPASPPAAIGSPYYREPDLPENGARALRSRGTGKSVFHAPPRP